LPSITEQQASLPSQASYAALAEESQAFFKHSCTTTVEEEEEEEEKEEEEERITFGCLVTFWFGTFAMPFSATGCVVHHENTRR